MRQAGTGIKPPVFEECNSSNIAPILCASTQAGRAKKKTLCAPREPQKVLVVRAGLLYPMRRMPYLGHRVDGLIGPFKAGNLLPF
jgi:hypothetical protein